MLIRPHGRDDADRIAEILAACWAQAYAGFMPKAFFAPRIDLDWRRAEIAEWLGAFDAASEAVFVAELEGSVAGLIHMELGDKGGLGATGIANLLYVDPPAQRRGLARALMATGARWLLDTRPGPLVLSAYGDNPYRAAYPAMGGREAKQVVQLIEGQEIVTVLYLWLDPAVLL